MRLSTISFMSIFWNLSFYRNNDSYPACYKGNCCPQYKRISFILLYPVSRRLVKYLPPPQKKGRERDWEVLTYAYVHFNLCYQIILLCLISGGDREAGVQGKLKWTISSLNFWKYLSTYFTVQPENTEKQKQRKLECSLGITKESKSPKAID